MSLHSVMERMRSGEPITIAFLGDSITQGCFEGEPRKEDEPFVYHSRLLHMIKEKYPKADIRKINAGIGGNTAGMGLFRMEQDVIEKKPDMCVVCFGLNDTPFCALNPLVCHLPFVKKLLEAMGREMDPKALELLKQCKPKEAYRYSMSKILERLAQQEIPTLVLLPNRMSREKMKDRKDPAYFLSGINAKMVNNGSMDEMMEIAKTVAISYRVPVADGYSRWIALEKQGVVTNDSYVNGTNHPSRELHQELANVLFEKMERL